MADENVLTGECDGHLKAQRRRAADRGGDAHLRRPGVQSSTPRSTSGQTARIPARDRRQQPRARVLSSIFGCNLARSTCEVRRGRRPENAGGVDHAAFDAACRSAHHRRGNRSSTTPATPHGRSRRAPHLRPARSRATRTWACSSWRSGLPYDTDEGRDARRVITALMHGEAYDAVGEDGERSRRTVPATRRASEPFLPRHERKQPHSAPGHRSSASHVDIEGDTDRFEVSKRRVGTGARARRGSTDSATRRRPSRADGTIGF